MNKNKHYLISDASRQVQVEAHVLRYWEDELGLPIPRNELGHRYYTEFHIQLFRQIKQLKEQGYQLKAIRGILGKVEENQKTEPEALLEAQAQAVFRETGTGERNMSRQENMEMKKNTEVENKETELPQAEVSQPLAGEKMRQFQEIMNQVIGRAIEENSEKLSQDVSYLVHDKLMKELEYLMRVSDEREEERFKRLDEVIRAYQRENQGRAEAAAAAAEAPVTFLQDAVVVDDQTALAWIMWNDGSWALTHSVGDTYNADAISEGLVATNAIITGEGKYTVGLDFTGTAQGYSASVAFAAIGISNGEALYPNYLVNIKEVRINGEIYRLKGRAYTTSDDGVCTRVNLYNEWVTSVPKTARLPGGNLAGATPTPINRNDAVIAEIKTIEIDFEYVPMN